MSHSFISTRVCTSCGAEIAGHLEVCPYCEAGEAVPDLLSPEAYKRTAETLLEIERKLRRIDSTFVYYFALMRLASVPIILSVISFIIFRSWLPALITLVCTGIIAFIRKEPAWFMFGREYTMQKRAIRKKYIPELNRLMEEYGAGHRAYEDVLLDIVEESEYGEFSPLTLIMDPADERK